MTVFHPSQRHSQVRSLRRTLIGFLMVGSLLPLLLVGLLSYTSIYEILFGKIKSGVSASLNQEAAALEYTINNLDFASKQFALDGQIVSEMSAYLQEKQIYRKSQIMTSINEKMNLVNFTNPNLGLTAYLLPGSDDPVLFSNLSMDNTVDIRQLPPLLRYNGAEYFGPHQTLYNNGDNMVFSELRSVQVEGGQDLYIYLETNYSLFRHILNQQSYGMEVTHLLVNDHGGIAYVENESIPSSVQERVQLASGSQHEEYGGYHLFRYQSQQGWQLVAVVKKSAFNSEIYSWLGKMLVLALSTMAFAALLALLIWKRIYRPLRKVNTEIVRMAENPTAPVSFTNVEEFDFVLNNFQMMKNKVNELIAAVAVNEQQKSQLEIEKLLSQINPHFLHNTLNTMQWLARMNGQKEIDKLATLLVKLLHYNLGKQSLIVTVADEIEAIRLYMELQRIRYDYEFGFQIHADEETMDVAVPRFLLQPIVENAIYHGLSDGNGKIEVSVRSDGDGRLLLSVADNGTGLAPGEAEKLLTDDEGAKRRGLGIGLSYVNRMLNLYYKDQMTFRIESEPGAVGTTVTIVIPMKRKEDFDA
ncbi:sensor histidine kinase [Paenibacillus kobensis]|uniref:sensor histidine kinase n=1 Tax=Paenibacillus kobensis TaxID=59841 RepID=UPI000FD9CDED|nr:histidine kinase [Paenibacillus kobensis]